MRNIPTDFYWISYVSLNDDLKHIKNEKIAYKHYLNFGIKENRPYKLPYSFNWYAYISLNKDLNHINDKNQAYQHYLNYGINENRPCQYNLPGDFDWKLYISLNKDLKHIKDEKMAYEHYLNFGIKENRPYKTSEYVNSYIHNFPNCNNIYNNNKKITIHNKNIFTAINEKSITFTRPFFEETNSAKCEVDENILNNLHSFVLVIDFNNGGGGTTIFLNKIVSKYKKYQTFVIVRNIHDEIHININEEYFINKKYNIDESLHFIDKYSLKILFVFVNHLLFHNVQFIDKVFNINKRVIGITHDYYNLFDNFQPYYHEIDELLKKEHLIDINKYSTLLTQHEINVDIFSQKYNKNIDVILLPDYKNSGIKIKCNKNKCIKVGIIGNITIMKGKKILEQIYNFYLNNPNVEIIVFGHVISDISLNKHCYDNITELNKLLSIHKPNILLELSIWPETYSYTLTLSMITKLPILYYKKKFNSVINSRLKKYNNAYVFRTLDELDNLIKKKKQDYFYTIEPIIYFDTYWDDLFINKKKINTNINNPIKYNIQPYFIYFPQFHKIRENDLFFYEDFNDVKNLELYNKKTLPDLTLETPLLSYLGIKSITNYNLTNVNIIQKQIDLIIDYQYKGFALYYYWFSINTLTNKNMIMKPVIDIFFSDKINMKGKKLFFIWANEDWTNNPAFGKNKEINIKNTYDEESFKTNGFNLLKYFKHDNYLKINNKPVFFVYHNFLLENLGIFYKIFNNLCICHGFNGIHLVLNTFNTDEKNDNKTSDQENDNKISKFYINFNYKNNTSRFFDKNDKQMKINYKEYIDSPENVKNNVIQTIVWDFNNKPRLFKPYCLPKSTVCINNTEINKILFTKKLIETYNRGNKEEIENILLINSFNEWGENMVFEPSEQCGYYNMNTLHNFLFNNT